MTGLLDFARGPALQFALAVFVFGIVWRLASLMFMPWAKDKSVARVGAKPTLVAACAEFFRRMVPKPAFTKRTRFTTVNGWVFHVGLAIIILSFAPHILFIKSLTGLTWPALPNIFIFAVGGVTVASLILALAHRLSSPVLQLISTMDDYVTWVVTIVPVLTGLAAASHVGLRYETLLAIHILSVCAFLIWFPFGKLMHSFLVFITRGEMGSQLNHRGIKL